MIYIANKGKLVGMSKAYWYSDSSGNVYDEG